MHSQTKSLLESLIELSSERDNSFVIESRGSHIIASAIALLDTIAECYDAATSEELEKNLLSSIRHRNSNKFCRGIKKIQESK
jgi:hypothetical protein